MSTVEFHRQAAEDARAARDAATTDETWTHHDRAWAAHLTAMNHLLLIDHFKDQASGARVWANRAMAKPPKIIGHRGSRFMREPTRAEILANLAHMERMPAAHRAHAERWGAEAEKHTAAAAKVAIALPAPADAPEPASADAGER